MTREEFKKELDERGYGWKEEGEWIIVGESGAVVLDSLKLIPNNVEFRNIGNVRLYFLKSIPFNVKFNNSGDVHLTSVKSIGDNVQFNNGGYVVLDSLKSIPINLDSEEILKNEDDIKINGEWLDLEKNISFPNSRWTSVDSKVQMYESWIKNNY